MLLQCIAKITFEREIWNVIDIIVALLLFGNVIWERVKGVGAIIALPPSVQLSSAYGYDVFISYYPELGYKFLSLGRVNLFPLRIPDYRRLPVAFHLIEILQYLFIRFLTESSEQVRAGCTLA